MLLPLPLLAVSTVGAVLTPGQPSQRHGAATAAVVGGAAVWSAVLLFRLRPDASSTWRLTAFVVHSLIERGLIGPAAAAADPHQGCVEREAAFAIVTRKCDLVGS